MGDGRPPLPAAPSAEVPGPVIDAHLHQWRWEDLRRRWEAPPPLDRDYLPEQLVDVAQRNGIRGVVLVEAGSGVSELVELAQAFDGRGIASAIVASLDLRSDTARSDLDVLAALPAVRGLRTNLEASGDSAILRGRGVIEVMRAVAESGLLWEFLVSAEQLTDVETCLTAVPGLRATIQHMGKPRLDDQVALTAWELAMSRLADATDVTCKLSFGFRADALAAHVRNRPGWSAVPLRAPVEVLLDRFGARRLMWGSDWPLSSLLGRYDEALAAGRSLLGGLPNEDVRSVLHDLAATSYRLPSAVSG